jgi:hypothetical protein
MRVRDRRAPTDEGQRHDRNLKGFTVVTPQVQTASSSHRTLSDQSHHSAYERLLAGGLGVALALVAALALMVPTTSGSARASVTDSAVTAAQATAHGKATPRTTSAATTGGGSTTVE